MSLLEKSFFKKPWCSRSLSDSQCPWLGAESYALLFLRSFVVVGTESAAGVDARLAYADELVDGESIFVGVVEDAETFRA